MFGDVIDLSPEGAQDTITYADVKRRVAGNVSVGIGVVSAGANIIENKVRNDFVSVKKRF